jgi:hypothetical protein
MSARSCCRAGRSVDPPETRRRHIGPYQGPAVSYVETGQKLVEVVELMEWAEAIGFDPREAIKRLAKIRK